MRSRLGSALFTGVQSLILPVSLIALWWVLSANSTSVFYPPLQTDVERFKEVWFSSEGAKDALITIGHFAAGYIVAVIVGVAGGIGLGLSPRLRRDLAPLLEFARAIPIPAVVPAALVMFGPGAQMEISLIAIATVWPILLNTIDGVRSVDETMLSMTRVCGVGPLLRIRRLTLPAAMPQIFAGMQVGLAVGLAITIIASMFGGLNGVGFFILNALRTYDIPSMWAGLMLLAAIGLVAGIALDALQKRVLHWHSGWRGERTGKGH